MEAWECFPKPVPPLPACQLFWGRMILTASPRSSPFAQFIAQFPSAAVAWGHRFHGGNDFGKDVILLCLLAKFPVEYSLVFCCFGVFFVVFPFPPTHEHPRAQPLSRSTARGSPVPCGCPRLPGPCQHQLGDLGLQDVSRKPSPPVRMDTCFSLLFGFNFSTLQG